MKASCRVLLGIQPPLRYVFCVNLAKHFFFNSELICKRKKPAIRVLDDIDTYIGTLVTWATPMTASFLIHTEALLSKLYNTYMCRCWSSYFLTFESILMKYIYIDTKVLSILMIPK